MKLFFIKNKYPVLLFFFVFIFYGNSIKNNYSFSDSYVINEQTQQGISAISEIFTTRYFKKNKINYGYRPITKTTFAIESSLFGQNPHISHFINVLLFALLMVLLFNTLKLIFINLKPEYIFFSILVFLAHPVHTEAVASLKNREEILVFIFGILTIKYIFKFILEKKWYYIVFSALSLVIGYYTKSTVSIIIATLPFFLYFSKKINFKQGIGIFLLMVTIMFISKKIPNLFLEKSAREMLFQENPLIVADFITRVGTGLNIMLFYLKKLIVPYPLSFYYGYNTIPITSLFSLSSIISLILFGTISIFAFIKAKSRGILYFSILSMIGTIFLFSNIITNNVPGIVADRYLIIPSLFFSLTITFFIFKLFKQSVYQNTNDIFNKKIIYVFIIILIPYFIIDFNRNKQWNTASDLIEHDIKHLQKSAMANEIYATNRYGLINELNTKQEKTKALEEAIKHYKISLKIYPEYKFPLSSLGNIYFIFYKDYKQSAHYYERYLKIDSTDFTIIKNTGFSYEKLKDYKKAIFYYKKAHNLKPNDLKLNSLIANKYYYLNNKKEGDYYNNIIMKQYPNSEIPYVNIGNYYFIQKDTLEAVRFYEQALNKNPNNKQLKTVLNNYYKLKNNSLQ